MIKKTADEFIKETIESKNNPKQSIIPWYTLLFQGVIALAAL